MDIQRNGALPPGWVAFNSDGSWNIDWSLAVLQWSKGERNGDKSYIGPIDKIPEHLSGRISSMMVATNIWNELDKLPKKTLGIEKPDIEVAET